MNSKKMKVSGRAASALRLFCAVGMSASSLGAVTLVNGSFEDLSSSYVDAAGTDSMSNVAADGWTVSTNSPDWFWGAPGPAGLWLTPWGDHFAVGAAGGAYREGISQAVTGLVVGESYEIGFEQANGLLWEQGTGYLGVGNVGGWEVLVDGFSVLSSASTNDNSTPALSFPGAWSGSAVTFEATAATQTIEFLAYDLSGGGPTFQFLDEVTVTQVPEPTAGVLGLLGVGLVVFRRRK